MRYQSRALKSSLEGDIDQAVAGGQRRGLIAVTFLAVFREGVETALFLSAAAFVTNELDSVMGALVGLGAAALVGYLIYASSVRLNLRFFFNITSVLLLVFAAGLLAHGIREFQEAGLLIDTEQHVWNTSSILPQGSTLGEILSAVIGYNATPTPLEFVGYWAYWALALFGVRWLVERKVKRIRTAPALQMNS
jgi:high-affinity iron transporter